MANNLMRVRHKLMTELIKLWKNDKLTTEDIDRLPLKLSPKHSKHAGRCCVHKERAVWKYKSLPLLGLNMEDETDELTPLSEYAKIAMDRASNGKPKDEIMCVVDEACSACVRINYEITEISCSFLYTFPFFIFYLIANAMSICKKSTQTSGLCFIQLF